MDTKNIGVKRILIVFALIGLFGIPAFQVRAIPSQGVSVLYTSLNLPYAQIVEYDTPVGNYSAPYSMDIDLSGLTWNATTANPFAHFTFCNVSDETTGAVYDLWFTDDNHNVRLQTGDIDDLGNLVVVATGMYNETEELRVRVTDDQIRVYNGTDWTIEYYMTTFDIDGVHAWGKVDSFTAGSVPIEFNDGGDFGLDIIGAMIPALVMLAVIGAVMKSFKKLRF